MPVAINATAAAAIKYTHPLDRRMQAWWCVILVTVLVTMVVEPYSLAFAAYPGLYPWDRCMRARACVRACACARVSDVCVRHVSSAGLTCVRTCAF